MTINEIKVTTIVPVNLSKLTLQATYFSRHYLQNLRDIDFVILQNIFRKSFNLKWISENALNSFSVVSLKLLKASFLL